MTGKSKEKRKLHNTLKYFCILLICIFSSLIVVSSGGGGGGSNNNPGESLTPHSTRQWTLMVYLDGDNNLEQDALDDINEMETAILDDNINVIVLLDRTRGGWSVADGNWTGTRLYEVSHDTDMNRIQSIRLADPEFLNLTASGDNEELNMGDPDTLSNFIDFSKKVYPAEYYGMILWNHGSGWRNQFGKNDNKSEGTINSAVCWDDDNGGDSLFMSEVKAAMFNKGMDLIGFDACLMAMVEVAYELKDVSDWMVASEELEPNAGWAYDAFLTNFMSRPSYTRWPGNLGIDIVDTYATYGETLSVIDLSKMETLVTAINGFADNLMDEFPSVFMQRTKTLSFEPTYQSYIDLYDLTEKLNGTVTGANNLLNALNDTVLHSANRGAAYSNSHGLSIFFPGPGNPELNQYIVSNIAFPGASSWDEFLISYLNTLSVSPKYVIETFHDSANTDTYLRLYDDDSPMNLIAEDDDSGNGYFSKIEIIQSVMPSGSTYFLLCSEPDIIVPGSGSGPYGIQIDETGGGWTDDTPATDVYEPNNSSDPGPGGPTDVGLNEIQIHYLTGYDEDWFKITVP